VNRELKEMHEDDRFRYFNNGSRPVLYKWRMPGLKYTSVLRNAQFYKQKNNRIRYFISEIRIRVYTSRYLIQIPTSTKIGRGLYIGHLGSLIVNPNAVIGDNVNLSTGVTIGQTNRGPGKGSPTIGNKVLVGTNAVVVGRINIGNNVLIAPNAYVNMDVPSNSIVIGNPAKIIPNEHATAGYVHNVVMTT
jgi:serine O-acetyltransferase